MKEVKAWGCDWCKRAFINPANAKSHENACERNPQRRRCITCVHGVMAECAKITKPLTIESYMPGADNEPDEYTGAFCAFHKAPISEKPYYFDCEQDEYDEGVYGYGVRHYVVNCPGTCKQYEYKGKAEWTKTENGGQNEQG